MDHLDDLLAGSAPPVSPSAQLDRVTNRLTARRPRRGLLVAGLVALSLGTGTAALAGTGTLDEVIDHYLNGHPNDHAWEMDITGVDGTFHCMGGIVVLAESSKPGYLEADYLAIKQFVQEHDWSDLEPDPTLLHDGQRGTAEQLAVTADRHMIVVAQEAGFSVSSISTLGTAQCETR